MKKNFLIASLSFMTLNVGYAFVAEDANTAASTKFQELDRQVSSLFENDFNSLPVTMSKDSGNIEVRVRWDGNQMLTFCQAKHVDLHPNRFRNFLTDFSSEFPKVNAMAKNIVDLETDESNKRDAVKTFLKFPFPLSDRIMIHWKYLQLDRNPDEHMLILSERGSERLLEKYQSEQEKKKFVLARTHLCAYRIMPVRKGDKVVGSKIQYVFSGDTGGSIPHFIQNAVGPKTAYDSVHGLIKHIRSQRTEETKADEATFSSDI
jgi:hypothetical protein